MVIIEDLNNLSNFEQKQLFSFVVENDIINLHDANELMQMKEREIALQEHDSSIWQGEDGRWRTHIKVNGKRKLLCKSTKEDLENSIIRYKKEEKYNPTVTDVYNQWIQSKLDREEIEATTKERYDRQYNQSMGKFGDRHIKYVDPWDVEEFVLNAIYDNELTQKGYSNLRTLIYGIFKQAKKQRLIDWSITDTIQDMEISRKSFRKITHEDDELVFQEDEKPKIYKAIEDMGYDVINLAIMLLFKTGVRPGEVVSLMRDDVSETKVHVCKTEIKRQKDKHIVFEVVDRTKTEAGVREVPVPKDSAWIIKRIFFTNPNGLYLFEINGKRINSDQLRQRLRTLCKRANITPKSPNKIRKTYASTLLDSGVNTSVVTKVMGHTNIQTTENYYHKNRYSMDQIAEQISAVNL